MDQPSRPRADGVNAVLPTIHATFWMAGYSMDADLLLLYPQ
jgi:hypothetical protein